MGEAREEDGKDDNGDEGSDESPLKGRALLLSEAKTEGRKLAVVHDMWADRSTYWAMIKDIDNFLNPDEDEILDLSDAEVNQRDQDRHNVRIILSLMNPAISRAIHKGDVEVVRRVSI